MQAVHSYRFVARVGNQLPAPLGLTGEFQAPDRVHENITIGGRPAAEVVFIGSHAFAKDPGTGAWRNRVTAPAGATSDLRAAFATLAHARAVIRRGATYLFSVPAAAATRLIGRKTATDVPASVRLTGGLIDTLTYTPTVSGRRIPVLVTYTDVNNAPAVAQPVAT